MNKLNLVFNILPIGLAIVSAIMCTRRFHEDRRRHDRIVMASAVVCSILLILAQTSWWTSYAIEGYLQGTWFANVIWALFNILVTVTFIMFAYRPKK